MAGSASYPAVLGVYSLRKTSELGSGATTTDRENVTYWYARQLSDSACEVQPLAAGGMPSGMLKRITLPDFIKSYSPEPFYYSEHPVPELDGLAEKLLGSEDGEALSRLDAGERKALGSLLVDPFDIADPSRPDHEEKTAAVLAKARAILKALLSRCETARFENRSRFSGFGVRLRKDGHYDESISYFTKALDIEKNDENVYFNMARVYYDMGDMAGCRGALEQALSINPEFPEAGQFARFIARKTFQGG